MIKFLRWLFRPRYCETDGCDCHYPNHLDDKCLVCRLPMLHDYNADGTIKTRK
ncbi:hypothetical protein EVB79_006 [Rhizobium phage RHph_N3_13]|nr:hypothetical protein EVB79_006 [Rhizobium phage RHph_N3_13]